MRDFHDQKDLFKAIHRLVAVEKHEYAKEVNWIAGHCYVIDIFLWFMARHGYTLQRAPQKLPFEDVIERTREANAAAAAEMGAVLRGTLAETQEELSRQPQ